MFKHWEFWFAIIGAVVSGLMMFSFQRDAIDDQFTVMHKSLAEQQITLVVQQTDLKYIREDVNDIKKAIKRRKIEASLR